MDLPMQQTVISSTSDLPAQAGVDQNRKRFPWIPILLSFLIGILFAVSTFLAYQYFKKPASTSLTSEVTTTSSPSPDPTTNQAPNGDLATWKTYTNTEYGFSLKYPSQWTQKPSNGITVLRTSKSVNDDADSFFITVHQNIVNFPQWVEDNEVGKIITSKTINNQSLFVIAGGLASESLEYATEIKPNTYLRFVIEPKGDESDQQLDQILSTFKFADEIKPSPTQKPQTSIKLNYSLPDGWQTAQDPSNSFVIGVNPDLFTVDSKHLQEGLYLIHKEGTQSIASYFEITPYDGGSRHVFLTGKIGETINSGNTLSDYKEVEYTIGGKNCLVLDGITISQFPQVWGMCPLKNNRALLFTTYRDYLTLLKTIKFL